MTIGRARRNLRRADRVLSFISAVDRGKLPQWAANKVIGKLIGSLTRGLWRR